MDATITTRPARAGDGQAVFDITRQSIAGLSNGAYAPDQIAHWMGTRTPAFYEDLIARGRMVVAERQGSLLGFVDTEPGEITRLFILPGAAGQGLGERPLQIGIAGAAEGHRGPIRLEATLNAERFYQRHGFVSVGRGVFSHGQGGDPIAIVHMVLDDRRQA